MAPGGDGTNAAALLRRWRAAPDRPLRAAVVGPGGHGKTVLLGELAAALADAGITVTTALSVAVPSAADLPAGAALLVDDAHLLPEPTLAALAELATYADGHLVVAHRPWPRPVGLAGLGAALAAEVAPVVLGPLSLAAVAQRASRMLGSCSPELAAAVHARTAGVPAWVQRLLVAMAAGPTRSGPATDLPVDSPELLAQLGYALRTEPAPVRALLLAVASGAPPDAEVLVPLLGLAGPDAAARLDDLLDAAAAAGLITAAGRAIPLVSAAVLAAASPAAAGEVRRSLAERELDRGGDLRSVAAGLLATGAGGARAATVLVAAAQEASRAGESAGALFAAAVRAGAAPLDVAAGWAEAALADDDLDLALEQADRVLSAPDGVDLPDLVRAGTVAAAVLARRGMLARSAELHRWLAATDPSGTGGGVLAVPALIGTGALTEAEAALTAARPVTPAAGRPGGPTRPPTLLAGAEELIARGVHDSVAGSPTAALSQLTRAAALLETGHATVLLTDTPAALAALVAVHCGELDVAESVLARAVAVGLGGPTAQTRHRLLLAWTALFRGATAAARATLDAAAPVGARLEPRDEFLAAALEVALTRRTGDLAALAAVWGRAREAIVRHPVDLFVLLQLGELAVAAARLREHSWVRPHLDEANALLSGLGDPALWAAPLHWAGLQAAIVDEDRTEAAAHCAALHAAADGSRYAAAMAAAAPHWVALLDAEVDAPAVEAAARGLHAVGMAWEGGKLAGQAAIRTRDRRAGTALLGCARALQAGTAGAGPAVAAPVDPTPPPTTGTTPTEVSAERGTAAFGAPSHHTVGRGNQVVRGGPPPGARTDDGPLSDRELEVAALVLDGLTYKQIGEQLFISAKTVEHHVARMRQRLGSRSRGELFGHLRRIVTTDRAPSAVGGSGLPPNG